MPEEKIYIPNDPLVIEGLLDKALGKKGVVICHPHSLMGGSMYNNVVEALQKTFSAKNISTLRFNFRGVGGSTGFYEEGMGEKEDILAVCENLKNRGMTELFFAGYSFGAWVGSKVLGESDNPFSFSVLISPPINYFDFEWDHLIDRVNLLICGDHDQFCEIKMLTRCTQNLNIPLEIIHGADHFYFGKEEELIVILSKYIINDNAK